MQKKERSAAVEVEYFLQLLTLCLTRIQSRAMLLKIPGVDLFTVLKVNSGLTLLLAKIKAVFVLQL